MVGGGRVGLGARVLVGAVVAVGAVVWLGMKVLLGAGDAVGAPGVGVGAPHPANTTASASEPIHTRAHAGRALKESLGILFWVFTGKEFQIALVNHPQFFVAQTRL